MKIKRFFAPDMRQAIRTVRDEQGPDAVILSTRSTAGGIEIVAAVDYDAELVNGIFGDARGTSSRKPSDERADERGGDEAGRWSGDPPGEQDDDWSGERAGARPGEDETAAACDHRSPEPGGAAATPRQSRPAHASPSGDAPQDAPQDAPGHASWPEPALARESAAGDRAAERRMPRIEWSQDPMLSAMQDELRSLRAILQDQVARLATADYDRRDPVRAEIVRRFLACGFEEQTARRIAAATSDGAEPARAWREALFRLANWLPVAAADPLERSQAIALVGATGVGKTTTAAKLAARACRRFGSKAVALVSTDDFRVGAHRQLASYGLLLGLPVRHARSAAELADQLEEFDHRRVVIVDTAGVGQRDARLIDETRSLMRTGELQSHLVLSSNVQQDVMEEVIEAFGADQLAGCILTKLDEATRLGPALSTALAHQLPISFVSSGQRVPEDIKIARPRDLVARALSSPGRKKDKTDTPWTASASSAHQEVPHEHA